jgi:hypothetical protein
MTLARSCAFVVLTVSCAVSESGADLPISRRPSIRQTISMTDGAHASRATEGDGVIRPLDVPGFEPALLFTPDGNSPQPLVVAAHGAGGGPEWECEYWRRLTGARVFILCLRGTPLGGSYSGYFFRDHRALNREFIAAEQAARAGQPRILAGSGLYAGFSQGATMGPAIIALHADAFPYVVLIEGFMSWNVPGARQFVRAGGRRLLLACGSKECAAVGNTSIRWFQVAGVEARLEYAPGAGHTPAGPVMDKVALALPWLLAGDPSWQ